MATTHCKQQQRMLLKHVIGKKSYPNWPTQDHAYWIRINSNSNNNNNSNNLDKNNRQNQNKLDNSNNNNNNN